MHPLESTKRKVSPAPGGASSTRFADKGKGPIDRGDIKKLMKRQFKKKTNLVQIERKKRQILFGTLASSRIFESAWVSQKRASVKEGSHHVVVDQTIKG